MNIKKAGLIIVSGLFLLIDQLLKWQSTHNWSGRYLIFPYFGWQPFANKGMAFGLPIPNQITVFITIPIIFLLIYLLIMEYKKPMTELLPLLAWSALLGGAISNFIDRIIYSHVIDYFLLATAVINLADVMIVFGLGIYMLKLLQSKKEA